MQWSCWYFSTFESRCSGLCSSGGERPPMERLEEVSQHKRLFQSSSSLHSFWVHVFTCFTCRLSHFSLCFLGNIETQGLKGCYSQGMQMQALTTLENSKAPTHKGSQKVWSCTKEERLLKFCMATIGYIFLASFCFAVYWGLAAWRLARNCWATFVPWVGTELLTQLSSPFQL